MYKLLIAMLLVASLSSCGGGNIEGGKAGESHTFTPDIGLVMQWCPPGEFMMESKNGKSNDTQKQRVQFSKGFWVGKTEVTQAQWQTVMGSNPSYFKGANLPVERVSWGDCVEFCRKLTERERSTGRLATGQSYRLPTEAEWEYACRAGSTGDYGGDLDQMAWYDKNSDRKTHPVAQKQANGWGLYDMHGNVWEWCGDWYGAYPSTTPIDDNSGSARIARGGTWNDGAEYCRSGYRSINTENSRYGSIGFRLALSDL